MRKLSEEKQQEIIRLYTEQRLSTPQVAAKTGVSSTCVSNIIKRCGLTPRNISQAKTGVKLGTKLPVDDIIQLYTSGKSSIEIARQLNVSKFGVLSILRSRNVPRNNVYEPKRKHASIYDAIAEAYADGMSMNQVAALFKVSYGLVSTTLKRKGLTRTHMKGKSQMGKSISESQKSKHRATKNSRKEQGLYDHIYLKRTGYTYAEFQKKLPAFKKYHQQVRSITQMQPLHLLENYDKRGKAGQDGAYHIDHKFSVIEGFKQGVDPKIIGHISNLHMIPWEANMIKQGECWISLKKLMKLYKSATT